MRIVSSHPSSHEAFRSWGRCVGGGSCAYKMTMADEALRHWMIWMSGWSFLGGWAFVVISNRHLGIQASKARIIYPCRSRWSRRWSKWEFGRAKKSTAHMFKWSHSESPIAIPPWHNDTRILTKSTFFKNIRLPKGSVLTGSVEGRFTKVHRGFTKVDGSSITSFKMSPKSSTLFAFFPNSVSIFWSSAIAKALGQNDTFVFLGSLQQMVFASRKVFCNVPQTVLYIGLTVSCGFSANGCCFRKVLDKRHEISLSSRPHAGLFKSWKRIRNDEVLPYFEGGILL